VTVRREHAVSANKGAASQSMMHSPRSWLHTAPMPHAEAPATLYSSTTQHPKQEQPSSSSCSHPNADTAPHVEPPHGSAHATSYGGEGGKGGKGDGGGSGCDEPPHTLLKLACWHASSVSDAPYVQSTSHSDDNELHLAPAPHTLAADAPSSSAQHPKQEQPRSSSCSHPNADTAPHVEPPHGSAHATSYGGDGDGGESRSDLITAFASQFKFGPIDHGSSPDSKTESNAKNVASRKKLWAFPGAR